MKYEKPKCDCGTELVYITEVVYEETQKINKNGEVSKKVIEKHSTGLCNCYWLKCPNCGNEYQTNMYLQGKLKGKMIRGELR